MSFIINSYRFAAVGYDTDAEAFFTATGITDSTQKSAVNQLVLDLKGYSIWTKMPAIYPMVGGTASTHKYNLKDPRDLDAAYRLLFSGGWTHSASGALPNGTNGYANTFFIADGVLPLNSNGIGYYSGSEITETIADPVPMGVFTIAISQALLVAKSNTVLQGRANNSSISYSTTVKKGHYAVMKTSSTVTDVFLNGAQVATGTSGGALPTQPIYIGNLFFNGILYANGYTKNDFRFAYICEGLSDTEVANLHTSVQAMQTTLARNV